MAGDSEKSIRAYADLIVRGGLNLQPGQSLLVAEPYELQGGSRHAGELVTDVAESARAAGAAGVDVIWGDEARLRRLALASDQDGFESLARDHSSHLSAALARGDALLFLLSSHPGLLEGSTGESWEGLRRIAWTHFGPIARDLALGATNWTAAPAPTPAWAASVYPELPEDRRLSTLWSDLLKSCRIGPGTACLDGWNRHMQQLQRTCGDLNARRLSRVRFRGRGTDLTVSLPPGHVWCTSKLATPRGIRFTANLPTEEVFTLPHRDSAEGRLTVARPIVHGGAAIDGIELEFGAGRVVGAKACAGAGLLQRLLETDEGAVRLGEIAWIPGPTEIARTGRLFGHPLLDENALPHVALGAAYPFTLRDGNAMSPHRLAAAGANQSLIHVDLPVDVAEVAWLP